MFLASGPRGQNGRVRNPTWLLRGVAQPSTEQGPMPIHNADIAAVFGEIADRL
jgi:hypothetical protein